jgi:flagellar biosynthesis protein FlhG
MGDDQAAKLRQLFNQRRQLEQEQMKETNSPKEKSAQVIAVTGGKGGIGKTNISANLSIALANAGRRVAVLDADYALANIDILLGLNPKVNIENVLDGSLNVGEILLDGPGGIKVVPASSGVQRLANLSQKQLDNFINALRILDKHFDTLVVDTAAGIGDEVITVLKAAHSILVITNPEPPAFIDSYALIKHLVQTDADTSAIKILVNQVSGEKEARAVFKRIDTTVSRFLGKNVEYFGHVVEDQNVRKAVRQRRPFVLEYPNSGASRCIIDIAEKINKQTNDSGTSFWQNLQTSLSNK